MLAHVVLTQCLISSRQASALMLQKRSEHLLGLGWQLAHRSTLGPHLMCASTEGSSRIDTDTAITTVDQGATADVGCSTSPHISTAKASSKGSVRTIRRRRESHLRPGPVLLNMFAGLTCLTMQAISTNGPLLEQDAHDLCVSLGSSLPFNDLLVLAPLNPSSEKVLLYIALLSFSLLSSFFFIPATFPPLKEEANSDGNRLPSIIPRRSQEAPQHELNYIDYSYMALNMLCMPGIFYNFFNLMRSFGLDINAPPLFCIYPDSPKMLIFKTVPELCFLLPIYFLAYEFCYYWWHRTMHESPVFYQYIHKHHHQQKYPDRGAIDTFNTGCIESQVGLHLQLAVLWLSKLLGLSSLPAAIWFFSIAGWLSVLEHDKHDRTLLFDWYRTDDHHMHHSYVKCNFSPYSTVWDRVYGTFQPFKLLPKSEVATTNSEA